MLLGEPRVLGAPNRDTRAAGLDGAALVRYRQLAGGPDYAPAPGGPRLAGPSENNLRRWKEREIPIPDWAVALEDPILHSL